MGKDKVIAMSGRDHYAEIYRTQLELEAEWLRYGAIDKVNSIQTLLDSHGIKPSSVLELGCGTGAVIVECQRRGIGAEFTAVDYSQEAVAYLESHSQGISCVAADITDPAFTLDRAFDVVVLSHVLEHLEDPLRLLRLLVDKIDFRYLVAEVPLENLAGLRLKNFMRDRRRNTAGHVQFFTGNTFRRLLSSANLELAGYRRYAPVSTPKIVEFVCKKDHQSRLRTMMRKATACYLPRVLKPFWERIYYAHYAALCVPKQTKSSVMGAQYDFDVAVSPPLSSRQTRYSSQ